MISPPFQISENQFEERPRGRSWVWIVVASLLALFSVMALVQINAPAKGLTKDGQLLQKALDEIQLVYSAAKVIRNPDDLYRSIQDALDALPLKSEGAKGARARYRLILKQHILGGAPNFDGLNYATDDIADPERRAVAANKRQMANALLRNIYSSERLSIAQAEQLKRQWSEAAGTTWPRNIVLEDIDKKAGIEVAKPNEILIGAAIVCVFLGGIAAWIIFIRYRLLGGRPKGLPLQGANVEVADTLGYRFLAYLLLYLFVPTALFLLLDLEGAWMQLIAVVVIAALGFAIFGTSIGGRRITLKDMGWKSGSLSADVFWGVGAWLANWPVVLVFSFLGQWLLRWIPSGEHPAVQEAASPGGALPLVLAAAVMAPIIEETFFRGCFYQGLGLRFKSVALPIFLASFGFAAIHPQGGAMWLSLGWIGAMGCLLTRERASIVPAVVMHALHNGSLMLLLFNVGA